MSTPCSLSRCRTTAMPLPGAPRELSSDDSDVLGFLALPAWGHVELDALAVFERPVAIALNRREVDEYVVPAFTLDEAEALLRVEPFHSALRCHVVVSLVVIPSGRCQQPAGGTRVQYPFGGVGRSEADSYLTGANRNPRDTARQAGATREMVEPVLSHSRRA